MKQLLWGSDWQSTQNWVHVPDNLHLTTEVGKFRWWSSEAVLNTRLSGTSGHSGSTNSTSHAGFCQPACQIPRCKGMVPDCEKFMSARETRLMHNKRNDIIKRNFFSTKINTSFPKVLEQTTEILTARDQYIYSLQKAVMYDGQTNQPQFQCGQRSGGDNLWRHITSDVVIVLSWKKYVNSIRGQGKKVVLTFLIYFFQPKFACPTLTSLSLCQGSQRTEQTSLLIICSVVCVRFGGMQQGAYYSHPLWRMEINVSWIQLIQTDGNRTTLELSGLKHLLNIPSLM